MNAFTAHELVIDFADAFGGDPAGVTVTVELAEPRLVFPVNGQTIYPTTRIEHTDTDGIARFNLLPSAAVGDYRIAFGGFERVVTMPDRDARLSELADA